MSEETVVTKTEAVQVPETKKNQWAKFQTVPAAEVDGVWYDFGNGAKFLLARAGGANKKYEAAYTRLMKPLQRQIQAGTASADVLIANNKRAYAESVVLAWEGVFHPETGEVMPHTVDNVVKLFDLVPEVWTFVIQIATDYSNFSREAIEAAAKN